MIVKVFDNGWGREYPLKQYEQSVIDVMLAGIREDDSRTVVINSVWYTQDSHDYVLTWLRQNEFDHIVLVALLDAAIPYPDRYAEFNRPVSAIGYYPGAGHLDFCALFVDHFLQTPSLQDLLDSSGMQIPFMCLNRKPHWHRRQLYERLQVWNLLDKGLISMGSEHGTARWCLPTDTVHDDLAPNASADHYGIPNDIVSLGHPSNWRSHFLNIVTETFYDINSTGFVSEKIYKPIVGCRPFLVYDPDGACAWLQNRGFETYVNDFTDISDLDLSIPGNMAPFLSTLCDQSVAYYQKKFVDLQEKILYNKERFRHHVDLQNHTMKQGLSCPI